MSVVKEPLSRDFLRQKIEAIGTPFLDFLVDLGVQTKERFELINSGGCGIYAAEVGHYLTQLGFSPEVLIVDDTMNKSTVSIREARLVVDDPCNLAQWKAAGVMFMHVVIYLYFAGTGYYVDVDGHKQPRPWRRLKFLQGEFTVTEMVQLSRQRYLAWNETFDYYYRAYKLRRFIRSQFLRFFKQRGLKVKLRPTRKKPLGRMYIKSRSACLIRDIDIDTIRRTIKQTNVDECSNQPTEELHV